MGRTTRVAAFCGTLAVLAAPMILHATPAAAVSGLRWIEAASASNSTSPKTISAVCPSGTRVIGGGGNANDNAARKVMLTEVRPILRASGGLDVFRVSAVEPAPGYTGSWTLTAYALCAPSPSGLEIQTAQTASNSSTFKHVDAACGSGKRTVSAGATVSTTNGTVGLNLVRPDGPLTIGRATAREVAAGTSTNWSLTAYALCVNGFAGQHAEAVVTDGPGAVLGCKTGKVHSVGGGGSLFDVGSYHLQALIPNSTFGAASAFMTGAPPNGMVVQATCAT